MVKDTCLVIRFLVTFQRMCVERNWKTCKDHNFLPHPFYFYIHILFFLYVLYQIKIPWSKYKIDFSHNYYILSGNFQSAYQDAFTTDSYHTVNCLKKVFLRLKRSDGLVVNCRRSSLFLYEPLYKFSESSHDFYLLEG